jgi:para-aminobenzoate synthetase component 1
MGHDPFLIFKSKGTHVNIQTRTSSHSLDCPDPLALLGQKFSEYQRPFSSAPFFQGGLVGYFGYELGRMWENIPTIASDDQHLPDILVAFYDRAYLYDRSQENGMLIAIPIHGETSEQIHTKIVKLKTRLQENEKKEPLLKPHAKNRIVSNFIKEDYLCAIRKAKNYISKGNIYQVNLSQRFKTSYSGKTFPLFEELVKRNPAPYASFFNVPDFSLLSLSPERFLYMTDKHVQTCPIKGTRPRSTDPSEDSALKHDLLKSQKDAAELLMIVDLERNDLGKVCKYGSVKVTDTRRIETHPTVFHLVSTVEGILKKGMTHFDCLKAAFPGGSITGAPKIRAMKIIEELEPTRRNLYTGSFGYMGFNGISDLSILIRTMIQKKDQIFFQLGSGIVSDSDPELEYLETLAKGKTFFDVLSPSSNGTYELV